MDAAAAQGEVTALRSACPECGTDNPTSARFCKNCGAALAPPEECPECGTSLPNDAKFCPSCGAKVVGPRPLASPASTEDVDDGATATQAARQEIRRQAQELPAPPTRSATSSLGGNVLLFVAILALLVVVIYVMNRDAPKEHNPFQGGPPPAAVAPSTPAAPPAAAAAPAGADPVSGTIEVPSDLAKSASGTIFVVVRMAGSPNRGPPLAVKRIQGPSFPQKFSVGPSDVMMPNMPFTGPFDVYVRLDRDGNAMTKDPGDLTSSAPKTGIKPGTSDIMIMLDKQL